MAKSRLAGKFELRWAVPIIDIRYSSHSKILKLASFRKRRAGLSATAGLSCFTLSLTGGAPLLCSQLLS